MIDHPVTDHEYSGTTSELYGVAEWPTLIVVDQQGKVVGPVAKKKLAGEGLFRELKRRRFYEKPSLKKKNKEREAQRRRQKWLAKHRIG